MTKQERIERGRELVQRMQQSLLDLTGCILEPVSVTGSDGRPIALEIRIFAVDNWTPPVFTEPEATPKDPESGVNGGGNASNS